MTTTLATTLDWDAFITSLGAVEVIRDRAQVEKLSKDYYYFSPILQAQLADKTADLVVRPASEAEVLQVAKACVAAKVPVTVRGAGTVRPVGRDERSWATAPSAIKIAPSAIARMFVLISRINSRAPCCNLRIDQHTLRRVTPRY